MPTNIEKLASAIYNNVSGGLSGYHINFSISLDQLEDAVVQERLAVVKQYILKGLISPKDLYLSINCIPIDCKDIEKCKCEADGTPTAHFVIPQLLNDFGDDTILYLGSTDKTYPFIWYTSPTAIKYHKYKKRGKNKPFVWIDTTPNEEGMYDCFVFNAPLLSQISITAIFKDPRQLEKYECCIEYEDDHFSFIDAEIIDKVSQKMLKYYKQLYLPPIPNNQIYTPT